MKQYFEKMMKVFEGISEEELTKRKSNKTSFGSTIEVGDKVLFCLVMDNTKLPLKLKIETILEKELNKLNDIDYKFLRMDSYQINDKDFGKIMPVFQGNINK